MRKQLPDSIKIRRKEIKVEALKKLRPMSFYNKYFFKEISITGSGIDEWLNQPHKHYAEKNEMLLNIKNVMKESNYMGVST